LTSKGTAVLEAESKNQSENKDPKVLELERLIDFDISSLLMIKEIIVTQDANRTLIEDYNLLQENKRDTIKPIAEMTIEDRDLLFGMLDLEFEKKKQSKSGRPLETSESEGPDKFHSETEESNQKSA
jgi:hypothetical protein